MTKGKETVMEKGNIVTSQGSRGKSLLFSGDQAGSGSKLLHVI
jgi:hypothetical protein